MRYLPPWRHQDGSSKHRAPVSPEQCSHLATLGPFSCGLWRLRPPGWGMCHLVCHGPASLALRTGQARGHLGRQQLRAHITMGLWMLPVLWPGPLGVGGQPGPLLGPAAVPSTRGPPRAHQRPESGAAPGLFCGENHRLGEGRAGHVPRLTQPLNGRAERQMGSPELLAAASTSASPHTLHPGPSLPSQPPQGLLRPHPPALPATPVSAAGPPAFQNTDSWAELEQSPSHPSRAAPACPILPAGWAGRPYGGRMERRPCPPAPGSASPLSTVETGTGLGALSWDSSSAGGTPEAGMSWCRLVRGHAGPGGFQSPVDPTFSWRKSVNVETSRGGAPRSSAKTLATNCKLTRGLGGKTGQRVDGVTARPPSELGLWGLPDPCSRGLSALPGHLLEEAGV